MIWDKSWEQILESLKIESAKNVTFLKIRKKERKVRSAPQKKTQKIIIIITIKPLRLQITDYGIASEFLSLIYSEGAGRQQVKTRILTWK